MSLLLRLCSILLAGMVVVSAQQIPDLRYSPPIESPAYAIGEGPRVGIDEAHHNFHTADGRYGAFAKLLRRDGYVVVGHTESFSKESLSKLDVLVIANPLNEINDRNWKLPTPSAFTEAEIKVLHAWVQQGGALFMMLDHMPFPGSAGKLAAAFGFEFSNGFVELPKYKRGSPDIFDEHSGLIDHAILRGRTEAERIGKVATFTGSAFKAPPGAHSILMLPENTISKEPDVAWKFDETTRIVKVGGWSQGAVMTVGAGRLAVFGEAGMFTAQLACDNKRKMGITAPGAEENYQFLLNVMHWLTELPGMSR